MMPYRPPTVVSVWSCARWTRCSLPLTVKSMRTLCPGVRLGMVCGTRSTSSQRNWRRSRRRSVKHYAHRFTPGGIWRDHAKACAGLRSARDDVTLPTRSHIRLGRPMASASGAGVRTRRRAGMRSSKRPTCPSPAPCGSRPIMPARGNCWR